MSYFGAPFDEATASAWITQSSYLLAALNAPVQAVEQWFTHHSTNTRIWVLESTFTSACVLSVVTLISQTQIWRLLENIRRFSGKIYRLQSPKRDRLCHDIVQQRPEVSPMEWIHSISHKTHVCGSILLETGWCFKSRSIFREAVEFRNLDWSLDLMIRQLLK